MVPGAAPRALFPGAVTIQSGETVAAPREQVVWARTEAGWMVLTDTSPRVWSQAASLEIVTTAELAASDELADALFSWNTAFAARLAHLVAGEPIRRARNAAAAARADGDAAAETRQIVAGILTAGSAAQGAGGGDSLAWVVARANAAVAEGADPVEAASRAADQAGLGRRAVAIDQPLDHDEGPKLLVGLEDGEGGVRLGSALSGARGYSVFDASGARASRPRLADVAVAVTEPLPDRLTRAMDQPASLMARVVSLAPMDVVAATAWGLIGIVLGTATPAAVNQLFTSIWPRADFSGHWLAILVLVAIALAGIGCEAAGSLRSGRLVLRFASILENGVWLRLARAAPHALTGSGGDTQDRFATASYIHALLRGQPVRFATDLGIVAAGIGQMIYYGGHLAWIGLAALAPVALCGVALMPRASRARTDTAELGSKQNALLAQAIAAVTKIKATASENFVIARWAALADSRRVALRRAERMETISTLVVTGTSGFATAAVFAMAGLALGPMDDTQGVGMVLAGGPAISLGAFLAFQVSLGQTMFAVSSAAGMTALWPALAAAGARLRPLATLAPEVVGQRNTPPPLDGGITMSHVVHHYAGSETASLDDVDLRIAPRDYVAIVGASGSGKSTFLRLLLGLEQPDRGAIYFDGLDAKHLEPGALRRQIGYVGQDSRLAPGSILDNILDGRRLGAPAAWEAARLAGLADDIDAMPMGMQTLVGEGGQNISGGQRQRILIARAVLSRPRILIFDEATSALDNGAQAIVQRGLAELPVTRIVVAHRLSTVRTVDKVIVLEKGRVVESGPPDELLRRNGPFAALAGRQLAGRQLVAGSAEGGR
jgi:ATP-binding cassette subfamily C protein